MHPSMRCCVVLALLAVAAGVAAAATITGTVYDYELDKVAGAVITINTTPVQTVVATDGTYSLQVRAGTYDLKVGLVGEVGISQEDDQQVVVDEEGVYNLDFILFPEIQEDLEELDIDESLIAEQRPSRSWLLVAAGAVLVAAGIVGLARRKGAVQGDEETQVLSYLRRHGAVATQKELRKSLAYSEARISLVLTSLEAQGKVIKIRKGRGNIIKLRK